jgi:hypothetical protein
MVSELKRLTLFEIWARKNLPWRRLRFSFFVEESDLSPPQMHKAPRRASAPEAPAEGFQSFEIFE